MDKNVQGMIDFVKNSPTAFHAVDSVRKMLGGFTALREGERWHLEPGGKYYVTRNCSSLIAFTLPEGDLEAFQLVASHSDSPTFKIKENAEITVQDRYIQLDTERYGGMIMNTWLDRPLSVAGRVIVRAEKGVKTVLVNLDKDSGMIIGSWFDRPLSVAGRILVRRNEKIETCLVDLDRDMVIIPNVAIHMNRDINNGYKYNPAADVFPLWGSKDAAGTFRTQIAKAAGVQSEDVLGSDLYLYNRVPGTVWGVKQEYFSAPRLDDLECVYSSVQALLMAGVPERHANVCCVFDNEEVGSTTKQGADSSFLYDVLHRILLSLGYHAEQYYTAIASSFMLSADNAHAVHPNHPEFSDPVNKVFMNGGIVVKFNANQKYTTDAVSEAVFHSICRKAGVPVQHYANRSDMPGGGTLGNIAGSHVSVNTLDIGLAQLAMHSCCETAGVLDIGYMIDGMRAFYGTEICMGEDGKFTE